MLSHYSRHSYCGQVFKAHQPLLFFKKQVNESGRWKTLRKEKVHTHACPPPPSREQGAASVTVLQAQLVFYGLCWFCSEQGMMSRPHGNL